MGGLLNKDLPYGGGSAIDFAESIVHEIPISIRVVMRCRFPHARSLGRIRQNTNMRGGIQLEICMSLGNRMDSGKGCEET